MVLSFKGIAILTVPNHPLIRRPFTSEGARKNYGSLSVYPIYIPQKVRGKGCANSVQDVDCGTTWPYQHTLQVTKDASYPFWILSMRDTKEKEGERSICSSTPKLHASSINHFFNFY
jgi:hypothetical protein